MARMELGNFLLDSHKSGIQTLRFFAYYEDGSWIRSPTHRLSNSTQRCKEAKLGGTSLRPLLTWRLCVPSICGVRRIPRRLRQGCARPISVSSVAPCCSSSVRSASSAVHSSALPIRTAASSLAQKSHNFPTANLAASPAADCACRLPPRSHAFCLSSTATRYRVSS